MAGTKRAKPSAAKPAAKPAKKQEKSAARRAKKSVAAPKATRAGKPLAAAAPLLAAAPKKVGKVTRKTSDAVKPNTPSQPKTDVAPRTPAVAKPTAGRNGKTPPAAAVPAFDPLALARPWIQLGLQMTMSNLTLQARIAGAAMDLPPTAAAMRQGSAAYKAWLAMLGGARPAKN